MIIYFKQTVFTLKIPSAIKPTALGPMVESSQAVPQQSAFQLTVTFVAMESSDLLKIANIWKEIPTTFSALMDVRRTALEKQGTPAITKFQALAITAESIWKHSRIITFSAMTGIYKTGMDVAHSVWLNEAGNATSTQLTQPRPSTNLMTYIQNAPICISETLELINTTMNNVTRERVTQLPTLTTPQEAAIMGGLKMTIYAILRTDNANILLGKR